MHSWIFPMIIILRAPRSWESFSESVFSICRGVFLLCSRGNTYFRLDEMCLSAIFWHARLYLWISSHCNFAIAEMSIPQLRSEKRRMSVYSPASSCCLSASFVKFTSRLKLSSVTSIRHFSDAISLILALIFLNRIVSSPSVISLLASPATISK